MFFRFLLLLDDAPSHPKAEEFNAFDPKCQGMYFPPNATRLVQQWTKVSFQLRSDITKEDFSVNYCPKTISQIRMSSHFWRNGPSLTVWRSSKKHGTPCNRVLWGMHKIKFYLTWRKTQQMSRLRTTKLWPYWTTYPEVDNFLQATSINGLEKTKLCKLAKCWPTKRSWILVQG